MRYENFESLPVNRHYKKLSITKLVEPKALSELTRRNDVTASLYLLYHLAIVAVLGFACAYCLHHENYLFFVLAYSAYCLVFNFFGTAGAMHELAHATVFREKALNRVLYFGLGYLLWVNPSLFLATHFHHHRAFLSEGDVEGFIGNRTPLNWKDTLFLFIPHPRFVFNRLYYNLLSARGIIGNPKIKAIVEADTNNRFQRDAIITFLVHGAVVTLSVYLGSILPVLLLSLPTFFMRYLVFILGASQHNVGFTNPGNYNELSASVSMNLPLPIRALYWNMNYHGEHHIAPAVPHYNLKALHTLLIQHETSQRFINTSTVQKEILGNYVQR